MNYEMAGNHDDTQLVSDLTISLAIWNFMHHEIGTTTTNRLYFSFRKCGHEASGRFLLDDAPNLSKITIMRQVEQRGAVQCYEFSSELIYAENLYLENYLISSPSLNNYCKLYR
jgi:hypothetical protein